MLEPFDRLVRRRLGGAVVEMARGRGVQRIVDQRGLARARDAGDAGEQPHREVERRRSSGCCREAPAISSQRARRSARVARRRQRRCCRRPAQVLAGQRVAATAVISAGVPCAMTGRRAARARTHVDDVVGGAGSRPGRARPRARVAEVAQMLERVEQALVVALVQADRRLVEHVHHARQARADLAREPDALRLAARERVGAAIERQIVEPDVVQETAAGCTISLARSCRRSRPCAPASFSASRNSAAPP